MHTDADSSEKLLDFLAPHVEPDDVPALWSLLRARPLINTFIALFRGGDEEVLIRLYVLRELGAHGDIPHWQPDALRRHFNYIEATKLETVLKRLRETALIHFDTTNGHYQLSDSGRNAVAALAALLQFGENEDAELGFLTTQLAGMQATGTMSPEMLQHLLAKLNALTTSFEDAIASGSEFRILDARSRLSGNLRWLDKGTQILRQLLAGETDAAESDLLNPETARIAHSIGLAQSRLARVDAAFQRALNKIESQRVTLGASGVSSSDAAAWLRNLGIARIAALADEALTAGPQSQFLAGGHELLDRAESTLSEEVRQMEADTSLPPAETAPIDQAPSSEDLSLLIRLSERLANTAHRAPASDFILGGNFGQASYRLSLLTLLGNEEAHAEGPVAALTQMPYDLHLETHLIPIQQDEVASMSAGEVRHRHAPLPDSAATPE